MITVAFLWFVLGCLFGFGFAAITFLYNQAFRMHPGVDDAIEQMREARLSLEKARTRTAFLKAFEKHQKTLQKAVDE